MPAVFLIRILFHHLFLFQNTLELTLFDKDILVSDELTSVVFDVGGLKPGRPQKSTFRLNSEVSFFILTYELY